MKSVIKNALILFCSMFYFTHYAEAQDLYSKVNKRITGSWKITSEEDKALWNYLLKFNKTPSDASVLAKKLRKIKGSVPEAIPPLQSDLKLSPTLIDIKGFKSHIKSFIKRHAWVKKACVDNGILLYNPEKGKKVALSINGEVILNSIENDRGLYAAEYIAGRYLKAPKDRKSFVELVLASAWVIDYYAVHGNKKQQELACEAMDTFLTSLAPTGFSHREVKKVEVLAMNEIFWPLLAKYPKKITRESACGILAAYSVVTSKISNDSVKAVNALKWLIKTTDTSLTDKDRKIYYFVLYKYYVTQGAYYNAIYLRHIFDMDDIQIKKGNHILIKSLFQRHFKNDFKPEYDKYLNLLKTSAKSHQKLK